MQEYELHTRPRFHRDRSHRRTFTVHAHSRSRRTVGSHYCKRRSVFVPTGDVGMPQSMLFRGWKRGITMRLTNQRVHQKRKWLQSTVRSCLVEKYCCMLCVSTWTIMHVDILLECVIFAFCILCIYRMLLIIITIIIAFYIFCHTRVHLTNIMKLL